MTKELVKDILLVVWRSLAIIIVGNLIVSYAHFVSDLVSPLSTRWKISIALFHILLIVVPIATHIIIPLSKQIDKGDENERFSE